MSGEKKLAVLLFGARLGTLTCDRNGKLGFVYHDGARSKRHAMPLSLSLPLLRREHGHAPVDAFLWGLLPDNENVLDRWGREFHVSSRNPFALLAHVGEDCAGAVQIVSEERAASIEGPGPVRVEWLTEAGVAERLRSLRVDETAWSRADDEGRFSLAGAQPKVALFHDGDRWGIPIGRTPTTHILKPGIPGLDAQAENEHFCLALARAAGIPAAASEIARFDDELAIVVDRYDRAVQAGRILRVHQEDACQAMAVHPARKYEVDGGPGARAIAELIREHSRKPDEDLETFADALAFNWLIGGTDAHAKNYSFLIGADGRVRLAPLYDVASALPYDHLQVRKLRLAMRIGGKYRLWEIGRHEWTKLAGELRMDSEALVARVRAMAARLPDLAAELRGQLSAAGLDPAAMERLETEIRASATRFGARLALSSTAR